MSGKVDEIEKKAMDVGYVAEQVIKAIVWKQNEVMVAPIHHRLGLWIRLFLPDLYFFLMSRRVNS